jgi:hypothetical protein
MITRCFPVNFRRRWRNVSYVDQSHVQTRWNFDHHSFMQNLFPIPYNFPGNIAKVGIKHQSTRCFPVNFRRRWRNVSYVDQSHVQTRWNFFYISNSFVLYTPTTYDIFPLLKVIARHQCFQTKKTFS